MITLADILAEYGSAYQQTYGQRILPSHQRAMWDIEHCRTETFGGQVYWCDACEQAQYRYHSCKNRHCPQCQQQTAEQWLQKQQTVLLPVPHFLVTFTLPAELRPIARSNQKLIYDLLFRSAAAALQQLALDPRFVGGQIGLIGVLHTWARDLSYHPHVHFLVPGGGLSPDGQSWLRSRKDFLVHVKPLSILFRAKFRDALKQTNLFSQVPAETWSKNWVVHSKAVGRGDKALIYLARYVFRVAISNHNILSLQDGLVTFRYKVADTGQFKLSTWPAETFIHRFLQHVLPKGFVKVRYYGYFSPGNRHTLSLIQHLLELPSPTSLPPLTPPLAEPAICCPRCHNPLRFLHPLPRAPP